MPRDYGITVQRPGGKLFFSPLDYALGGVLLAAPEDIDRALEQKAKREHLPLAELKRRFKAGVRKKEGHTHILEKGGKEILRNVVAYAGITAQIISKTKQEGPWNQVLLQYDPGLENQLAHIRMRTENPDEFWNFQHGLQSITPHIAALEIAILKDNRSRKNAEDNYTGLLPAERQAPAELPFLFGPNSVRAIDVLCDYYLEGKTHYTINRDLLENVEVYGPSTLATLQQGHATYRPIRQAERTVPKTPDNQRWFGGIKALEQRLIREMGRRGLKDQGLGVEFKGTPNEAIARRFGRGDRIYSLVTKKDLLPLIVAKSLNGRQRDVRAGKDTRTDHPYQRVGQFYNSIDDVTRREAWTLVQAPSINVERFRVPDYMAERYARALQRTS